MSALYDFSLSRLRSALLKGECSATEAVQASLARIKDTDECLGACLSVLDEDALASAASLDKSGAPVDPATQPLWGVPVAVKDNMCLKASVTSCASKFLENFKPFYDAEVVSKLKNAGAIIVAKNNMDEFAMGSTTETSAFKRTANPWDFSRVPGGSSGGSAAAVAASQCFGALGSDTGGSIRQPAGLCGCVGLKPTYGRVSRFGVVAFGSSFDQVGPLTRTVEDSARMLSVIAGPDAKDSTSARLDLFPDKLPSQNFVEAALEGGEKAPADTLKGVKIGVPQEFWESGIDAEVSTACKAALKSMEDAGAILVPVSLPYQKYAVAVYYIMASAEASTNLARFDGVRYGRRAENPENLVDLYIKSRSNGFGAEVQRRIMLGTFVLSAGYYDAYYRKAAQIRRLLREDFDKALTQCDMLAAPASVRTAWQFGDFEADPLKAYKMDLLTVTLNLVGLPGISLPVGLGAESKLPVGLQLMGRSFDEAALLRVGAALEQLVPNLGTPAALK